MGVQITGARTTKNILQDRRSFDFTGIHLLEVNTTPLTAILSQFSKRKTMDPEYNWFEDALLARFTDINHGGGYPLTSETSLVVDDATIFVINDVIHVTRTKENMLVTNIDYTANTLTVTRGIGGTSAAAINDDDELLAIGTTFAEGTGMPDYVSRKVVKKYNYTQIFKTIIELTETEINSTLRGDQDLPYQMKKKGKTHSLDIERAFLFGSRNETIVSGKPRRQTGGVREFLSSNINNVGGVSLTESALLSYLRTVFEYGGSNTRTAFSCPLFAEKLTGFASSKLQITDQGVTSYGMNITKFQSCYGSFNNIMHRELRGDEYGAYAFILDLSNIYYRFLQNRDTKILLNQQSPGDDERIDQYKTEAGLELRHDVTHCIIRNFI